MQKSQIRSRSFRIELYEETESYDFKEKVEYLTKHYDYVCIRHDKDIFTEGEDKGKPKKVHWHFVIRWTKYARTSKALSKELGIDERFILPCYGEDDKSTSLKSSLLYLTHIDELDKYQYDLSEVLGASEDGKSGALFTLWHSYTKYMCIMSNEETVLNMSAYIKEQKYISTARFTEYCCVHGWLNIYKKYSSIINRILDEHNYRFDYRDE